MRAEPVDERDVMWERDDPTFRVFAFGAPDDAARVVDIDEVTLSDALQHARMFAEDDRLLWALAVVTNDADGRRGLVWLSGMDYRDTPRTASERARRREMQDRFLSARFRRGEPVVLPDGRRLVRMFPEWGCAGPLWESFTDNYPLVPATLPLPEGLAADLDAWNREWNARSEDEPLADPDGWRRRGDALADRLDVALAAVAEVRREYLD